MVKFYGPFFHYSAYYKVWARVLIQSKEPREDTHSLRGEVVELDLQPANDNEDGWRVIKDMTYRKYTAFHRPDHGDVYSKSCPPEVYAMLIHKIGQGFADHIISATLPIAKEA